MYEKKTRKTRRLLSLLLAILLIAGMFPAEAILAQENESAAEPAETTETLETAPVEQADEDTETEPETAPEADEDTETVAEAPASEAVSYANSISGTLWYDENEDGVKDSEEALIANYPVYLYQESDRDNPLATATSDARGLYMFRDITPGKYVVGIRAGEDGSDYLLPLGGAAQDNKFVLGSSGTEAYTEVVTVAADSVMEDNSAAMRKAPKRTTRAGAYLVTNDTSGATIGTYSDMADAVSACVTTDPCTITALADDTAINSATVNIPAGKNITLTSGSSGSYRILQMMSSHRHFGVTGNLTLTNVILEGADTGIGAGGIEIYSGGSLVMNSGAVIQNCYSTNGTAGAGGGVYVYPGGSVVMNSGKISGNSATYGGGMYCRGSFAMYGGEISDNTARNGGGIMSTADGTIKILNGAINDNTASSLGGGMYCTGSFAMYGGEVSNNTASSYGGGVYDYGTAGMQMYNGKINGNTANFGGGVYIKQDIFEMHDGEVSNNKTRNGSGGALYIDTGTFKMQGGVISGNTAAFNGGGLSSETGGTVELYNGEFSGNTTSGSGGGIFVTRMETAGYAGLTVSASFVFSGNTSSREIAPPPDALSTYTNIQTTSSSVYSHPLNDYDISRTVVEVTVYYVDRAGSAIGSPSTAVYYEGYGNLFSLSASQIPTITDYTFVDWKIGASGALQDNTTVLLDTVTAATSVYLIYAVPPTVTVSHSGVDCTSATLDGEYDLHGETFSSGEFEIYDPVTSAWITPTSSTSISTTAATGVTAGNGQLTGATTSPSITLGGLTSGTTYQYRLTVTSPGGTVTSTTGSFRTNSIITEKFEKYSGGRVDAVDLPDNPVTVTTSYTASGISTNYTVGGATYLYQGYKFDSYSPGDTLSSGTPAAVAVTGNREVYYIYRQQLVNLSISKIVTGSYGDPNKAFEITVTLANSGTPISGTYSYTGAATSGSTAPANGSLTFDASGQAVVSLKHGQTITIEELPSGCTYTVQETDAAVTGGIYLVTYGGTGTVSAAGDQISETLGSMAATVTIINDRNAVVVTGLSGTNAGMAAAGMLSILAVALVSLAGYRRRRKG